MSYRPAVDHLAIPVRDQDGYIVEAAWEQR
jgi:hypothetical protein